MRTVAFYTLGCKVNQYETEAMKGLFVKNGDTVVPPEEKADIYVINTCTVTSVGDKKSRQFIRRAKRLNENAIVAVVGCYAQIAPDEVMALDGVNLVLGTDGRHKIVAFLSHIKATDKVKEVGDIMDTHDFEELEIDAVSDKTRVFLKVQEGCNQFCSYCIIPYARGNIRSRQPFNVLKEVERVVAHGFKEVVLTGIHLASYGKDLGNISLADLIEGIHDVPGLERIRLGSLEPLLIDATFMQRLKSLPKVCDQFHLSLQSGCDSTLKRMNRRYNTKQYSDAVRLIREVYPLAGITTDVIVGFPGETDGEFEETLSFVKGIGFSQMHVFPYSKREGTKAYYMPDQVPDLIKQKRADILGQVGQVLQAHYLHQFIDQTVAILVEGAETATESESVKGLTPQHVEVICALAPSSASTNMEIKQQSVVLVKIRAVDAGRNCLLGVPVQ